MATGHAGGDQRRDGASDRARRSEEKGMSEEATRLSKTREVLAGKLLPIWWQGVEPPGPITWLDLAEQVAIDLKVDVDATLAGDRHREPVRARQKTWWLLHFGAGFRMSAIAQGVGRRSRDRRPWGAPDLRDVGADPRGEEMRDENAALPTTPTYTDEELLAFLREGMS
jgi:hypothetical protein